MNYKFEIINLKVTYIFHIRYFYNAKIRYFYEIG